MVTRHSRAIVVDEQVLLTLLTPTQPVTQGEGIALKPGPNVSPGMDSCGTCQHDTCIQIYIDTNNDYVYTQALPESPYTPPTTAALTEGSGLRLYLSIAMAALFTCQTHVGKSFDQASVGAR